ncbi:LCP family protein [Streptomyces californicus]
MPPGSRASRRSAPPRKRRRGLKITLGILLVLLLAGGGTVYWLYSQLDKNITGVDIDKALGDDRPEKLPT